MPPLSDPEEGKVGAMTTEELPLRLEGWIKEQVLAAKGRGVVVGLSGGLDSAVVAALCRRAFPQDTLCAILPCHSNPTDLEHARLVAATFSIPTVTITLDSAFNLMLSLMPGQGLDPSNPSTEHLAQANLKVRLRMVTLYYLANRLGYLVVGTGNRSERAVGYFTKYGDGGVDLMPLGNLVKLQVRALAGQLGVPSPVIDKPPTAGLWEGQTDEGEMGLTYEELDRYLVTGEATEEVRQKVEAMAAASAHKHCLPPLPPF